MMTAPPPFAAKPPPARGKEYIEGDTGFLNTLVTAISLTLIQPDG